MKSTLLFSFIALSLQLSAQSFQLNEIMKGNDFIGYSPENISWTVDGKNVLFDWNPNMALKTTLHSYDLSTAAIKEVPISDHNYLTKPTMDYAQKRFNNYYFNDNGNLARYDYKTGVTTTVYSGAEQIGSIQRLPSGKLIFFQAGNQLFCFNETLGTITQSTNFIQGNEPKKSTDSTYLQQQQRELFPYIKLQDQKQAWNEKHAIHRSFPRAIYFGKNEQLRDITISSNGQFAAFVLHTDPDDNATNYEAVITENGYTQRRTARAKVGDSDPSERMGIYDRVHDTTYFVSFGSLSGIRQKPAYLKEYGDNTAEYDKDRNLCIHAPVINETNNFALIDVRSYDNKDRWIVRLNFETGQITELDHQHDEAWIGGPGISGWNESTGTLGWLNATDCYFQSEETGYSHLYQLNSETKAKKALTTGKWEVYETILSLNGKYIYFLANKIHPGVRNGYQLEVSTGKITPLFEGNFAIDWTLSPDGKTWALRYSTTLNPWELYLAPNAPGAKMKRITTSTTKEFSAMKLVTPEIITVPTSDGKSAYARLYKPATPNGAAVLFVHGAGYLQNAHYFWSNYYREMLFHQKLVSEGYTVLDVDYRASEGYGRDWRTDIYRHMGERDLKDYIDAKKYLVDNAGIDANRVGIYGGSYGGFITLMGLLKTPGTFACGAALRSVTDWAHYNHEYTSNILNYPGTDPKAYEQSSPIYFAEGLKDPLVMLHGMVDDNVQFQDIVRLNQRFIELEKINYTLSVFPTEAHGFNYTPAWIDEYRRIYELFNTNLLKK